MPMTGRKQGQTCLSVPDNRIFDALSCIGRADKTHKESW